MTWQLTARFCICGYQCREVDLTPAVGLGFIALIITLVGSTTMGV